MHLPMFALAITATTSGVVLPRQAPESPTSPITTTKSTTTITQKSYLTTITELPMPSSVEGNTAYTPPEAPTTAAADTGQSTDTSAPITITTNSELSTSAVTLAPSTSKAANNTTLLISATLPANTTTSTLNNTISANNTAAATATGGIRLNTAVTDNLKGAVVQSTATISSSVARRCARVTSAPSALKGGSKVKREKAMPKLEAYARPEPQDLPPRPLGKGRWSWGW